jgi:hypothetical protein
MHCRSAMSLALLCSTAVAQPPATNSNLSFPNLTSPLTIVLRSDAPTPPRVLSAMEKEVESLTVPAGIRTNWVMSSDSPGVFEQLAVVTLRGVCRPGAPIPVSVWTHRSEAQPLGQTQVVDGQVLPFADLRCDTIRQLISRELNREAREDREDLLGRAMGRVLAHELYHIVLRTTSHGREGLAREAQSSSELTAERDDFSPSDERRLSQSVAGDDSESPASNR